MLKWRIFFAILCASGLLTVVTLGSLAPVAQAHGESVITVIPDTVAPGGKITVKGADMGAGEEFKIALEGLNYQADMGDVKADDQAAFTLEFTIPADAPEGVYQIKATGKDGDVVATELTITPSKAAAEAEPTPAVEAMPSAAEHVLARSRSPFEVLALSALVIVSAAVGLFLLRAK